MSDQRFIQYGNQTLEMEPGMTLDQGKQVMARHFPELAQPKVETKEKNGKTYYVFTKQAGRKGH